MPASTSTANLPTARRRRGTSRRTRRRRSASNQPSLAVLLPARTDPLLVRFYRFQPATEQGRPNPMRIIVKVNAIADPGVIVAALGTAISVSVVAWQAVDTQRPVARHAKVPGCSLPLPLIFTMFNSISPARASRAVSSCCRLPPPNRSWRPLLEYFRLKSSYGRPVDTNRLYWQAPRTSSRSRVWDTAFVLDPLQDLGFRTLAGLRRLCLRNLQSELVHGG